jgi:ectoine hydroxylase-related dioxygenase (phytanoyl-CoA dioxygenase family)
MATFDPANLPRPTKDVAQLKADLDAFGYCLVAEALDAERLARLRERLEEQAEAERQQGIHVLNDAHVDAVNEWITMLINKGEAFRDMPTNPRTLELVRHLLGPEVLLSVFEAHIVRKGGGDMALHCDQWWLPRPVAPDASYRRASDISRQTVPTGPLVQAAGPIWPPVVVNVMHMITDFTEENGATRIAPGSHLTGHQPSPAIPHPVETIAAEGPPGTAVIFEGRTWHAAGLNRTGKARLGITTTYCGPMFRQLTNFTVGVRQEVLDGASPELKRLLGFKVWSTYGGVDDHSAEFIERREGRVGELRRASP